MNQVVSTIQNDIKQMVAKNELQLVDIEYVKENGEYILRVLIDSKEGISIDDCEVVNNLVSEYLDEKDPIENEYFLEVSSAGAERELKTEEDLINSVDKYVFVKTNENEYQGHLLSYENGELVVRLNLKGRMKNITVKYEDVIFMRKAIKF